MTETYECTICSETWDDYYDANSHVYTAHGDEKCGIPAKTPSTYVRENTDD